MLQWTCCRRPAGVVVATFGGFFVVRTVIMVFRVAAFTMLMLVSTWGGPWMTLLNSEVFSVDSLEYLSVISIQNLLKKKV